MKMNLTFVSVLAAVFFVTGCGQKESAPPNIPASWHGLPEDQPATSDADDADETESPEAQAKVAAVADDYTEATADALEEASSTHQVPELLALVTSPQASDRVPWHMEYLMTDLSVSAGGLLGGLIMKGSPAVTFIWRKQRSQSTPPQPLVKTFEGPAMTDVSLTSATSDEEMTMQLEPAIRVAMATGKVKEERKLRSNLLLAAKNFQTLASVVGENPGLKWWVSRLRLDLTFEMTGLVTPIIGVGGDLRLRFEWHRIMTAAKPAAPKTLLTTFGGVAPSGLKDFMVAMAQDLNAISDEEKVPDGFKAYSYRVGLGVSVKGDIGIAKSSASLIGQVYFSRDVPKPKVHAPLAQMIIDAPSTINVIEDTATPQAEMHASYARTNSIAMKRTSTSPGHDQIVYKVDRKKIRKGLSKAAKIGRLFGSHSATSHKGKWKVFELRTAFDLSISGKIGMTELGGLSTTEINFYNQSF